MKPKPTQKQKEDLAARLDQIVNQCKMPESYATQLLSSAVLFLTHQCDLENFATAVAHLRLCIPEDDQDATAALAGWLDDANKILDP